MAKLFAVTESTAGFTLNDWLTEAALYTLFAGADAVILHTPTPVTLPAVLHGPEDAKPTARPEDDDAFNENVLPYVTSCNCVKLIVCDCKFEPCGRIENVPDTELAAL